MRLLGPGEGKVVECGEVERDVFGKRGGDDGKGGEERGMEEKEEDEDDDDEDDDDEEGGGGVPLPPPSSSSSSSPTSTPTTKPTHTLSTTTLTPQRRGLLKAQQREMVRQAARRGVAFGFEIEGKEGEEGKGMGEKGEVVRSRRKVECVKGGRVVESSFAKGEWGVRWRG